MNPIYSSAPREVQTIRCCGRIYKRWRFVGKRFFDQGGHPTYARNCVVCGRRLFWPVNFEPQRIAAVRAQERRDHYYDHKATLHLLGLTSKGAPRRRNFMPVSRAEANRRQLARWHARAAKYLRRNLTTRGTKRVYLPRKKPAVLTGWREFRAGLPDQKEAA